MTVITHQDFDRATYYKVLKNGGLAEADRELSDLEGLRSPGKEAFRGALLMKKAGLLHKAKDKLDQFKKGRIDLETVIHLDSQNTEYRFLRLIIQEHAPKITKYHDQLKEDSEYVRQHYKELPGVVQRVVRDYSKTSAVLHAADFEF
ncbi:hypothetical protein Q4E93_05310 [Flavitalea sp. BT771]|uniref:hypothetical protein n=1 Tax=Flavitalea sp. BT771 TaxID=3063329 RepID=UPI0026E41481|nr:hypothetical protein [Flavitalea sp. BT771]MDO6429990.1 hypothetical protein [Flavitalea sp. BT771]MDV6217882.1 hypothetical protein [Flavitalea sp. BT771]